MEPCPGFLSSILEWARFQPLRALEHHLESAEEAEDLGAQALCVGPDDACFDVRPRPPSLLGSAYRLVPYLVAHLPLKLPVSAAEHRRAETLDHARHRHPVPLWNRPKIQLRHRRYRHRDRLLGDHRRARHHQRRASHRVRTAHAITTPTAASIPSIKSIAASTAATLSSDRREKFAKIVILFAFFGVCGALSFSSR